MPAAVRPRRLRLDASTHCQLACPACPNATGLLDATLGRGHLQPADFAALLDANPRVREVELANCGEICLNPGLPAILEEAHARGVRVRADSGVNLNHAPDALLEAFVRWRLRSLTVSIDGATPATYARYRAGGDLDTVLANVRRLQAVKRRHRSRQPRLTWQFVVFGHNEHEIPAARRLAADLGLDFRLKAAWRDGTSPVRDEARVRREHWRSASAAALLCPRLPHPAPNVFCHQLWEEPQLNWDGRVLGCCCNHWADFGGNAFADGLADALNGERIAYARAMLQGHSPERPDIPCVRCTVYEVMKAEGRRVRRGWRRALVRAARAADRALGLRRWIRRSRALR